MSLPVFFQLILRRGTEAEGTLRRGTLVPAPRTSTATLLLGVGRGFTDEVAARRLRAPPSPPRLRTRCFFDAGTASPPSSGGSLEATLGANLTVAPAFLAEGDASGAPSRR